VRAALSSDAPSHNGRLSDNEVTGPPTGDDRE
jgi:hypothetical protein